MTHRRRARGFTLLEVAVAMAILASGVVTCLQIFTGSLRLQQRSSRQLRVALAARSSMDSLFSEAKMEPHCGQESPSAEGFVTSYCIKEAGPEDGIVLPSDTTPERPLLVLTVNVAWEDAGNAKTYTLRSLRLAPEKDDADVGLDR